MSEPMYTVGEIVNTQGIRGEIKVVPHTDFAEQRFAKGNQLIIVDVKGTQTPVVVQSSRLHKKMYILSLKDYTNINMVEKFKGSLLKITASEQEELDEDEYYYHEIIGCSVETEEGEVLGTIKEILTPGANDVWVVKRPQGKDLLLPVIDDVILDINVDEKKILVYLMEGLLEE
ncbi:ribosome maturation factor RimM [Paenibacillus sp. N1-5-1-14]|uniref:ribosome maturation factor RimM n=1 Tax=Paenibacillus radicibacter TaxID=2972488 RepID=UPI0021594E72|nr:ribosome maturation factor RimM [Paenibacillus radicibacter]MCR8641774.1 ribosome maturation factor RimM [Paenibacillus radicibacter]